ANYKSCVTALFLSLLLCLSSQVGVAEAKRSTLTTKSLDTRCARNPPSQYRRGCSSAPAPTGTRANHSNSTKGKGP
ncbi:unnamed protein product, partial [Brassica oleracea var. botrytis]